jgi:type I restriction enzyme S subunit
VATEVAFGRLMNRKETTKMNKIEKLIQQHCPNGVEFKELGEVCDISRGVRVTKKDLIENGKYPVVSGGIGYMGYFDKYNRESNTVTIAQYGTAGFVKWQTEQFWANDVCFSVLPNKELINNRYLYYILTNKQEHLYSISNRDAIPYSIERDKILQIKIPLPPLAVQQEIVNILDKFTELEAELEIELKAELEARKKQYEYYRAKLLSFNELSGGGIKS